MIIKTSYSFMKPPPSARLIRGHRLAQGLVGCWLFNEGSGNKVYDLSGNGNNLTLTGSWDIGGPKIDASTDRLFADDAVLSQTEGTFICCLNRFAAWSNYGAILNIETSANNSTHEMVLYRPITEEETIRFYPNFDESPGDYWEFGNYSTIFPLNIDVVVAVVWKDTSILKGYLDGIEVGSLTGDTNWVTSAFSAGERLSVGNVYGIDYETNCIYKWAYSFNRTLSDSEIDTLYKESFCKFERK